MKLIIKRLQDENATWVVIFKSSTNNLEQYGRRNIVISGIPDSVDINYLEESVTEILSDIDIKVSSNDIEAYHRIGKKNNRIDSTKTII